MAPITAPPGISGLQTPFARLRANLQEMIYVLGYGPTVPGQIYTVTNTIDIYVKGKSQVSVLASLVSMIIIKDQSYI